MLVPAAYNIYKHIIYESVLEPATFIGGVPLKRPGLYDDDEWGTTPNNVLQPFKGCVRAVVLNGDIANIDEARVTTNAIFKDKARRSVSGK